MVCMGRLHMEINRMPTVRRLDATWFFGLDKNTHINVMKFKSTYRSADL